MDWKIVCGILATEACAQLGLALTLACAFILVRLEFEHLVFALLSVAIASQTIASIWLTWPTRADPYLASVIVHSILAIASAIHLHYVLVVAAISKRRKFIIFGYAVAAIYVFVMMSGTLWPRSTVAELVAANRISPSYPYLATPPAAIGVSFYGVMLAEFGLCQVLLVAALRRGRKDIALVMLGVLGVTLAAANDITVMMRWTDSVFLLPHSFSIYGFFVGLSLLLRYRRLVVGYASAESSLHKRTEELRKSHSDLEQVQLELSSKKQLAAVGELAAAIDQVNGMDEMVLSRAVDPFFTTRPSGTGLGLPIVHRIVAAHGGKLQMDSELHRGTTVRLLLPIVPRDVTSMPEEGVTAP